MLCEGSPLGCMLALPSADIRLSASCVMHTLDLIPRRLCGGGRALRVVNPSPYMIYLQARGSILVASSPEILCRVGEDGLVTNRRAHLLQPQTLSPKGSARAFVGPQFYTSVP